MSMMKSSLRLFSLVPLLLWVAAEVSCDWGPWNSFSPCTKSCGCGWQLRNRTCNNVPVELGGPGCKNGSSVELRKCNEFSCPDNHGWGDWTPYGPCTCSCGGGVQVKTRTCNRLPQAHGGPGCPGLSFKTQECNTHPCVVIEASFDTKNNSGRYGPIQGYIIPKSGWYKIKAGGARGGTHSYNYGYKPGTYFGGKGATMEGSFNFAAGTVLKIVIGQRGGNSVEVRGGRRTTLTAAQLGLSVEDNAATGGGGGTFVYKADNTLLIAAGGGGGASGGYNGINGQSGTNGTSSQGLYSHRSRAGGSGGQPGQCNSAGASYHGGVGAGWLGQGCARAGSEHGERGGSLAQGWIGGRAGGMNSGYNGGPPPGAVGGFGGGGGGSEDNGASGGGGGYSGGGSGTHSNQAGGGGGSYCTGSGVSCHGVTGGNIEENGFVQIMYMSS